MNGTLQAASSIVVAEPFGDDVVGVSDEDRLVSNMAVSVDLVDHLAPADAEIGVVRAVTL